MTVAELVDRIKELSHDSSLTDPQIYRFIDRAIKYMEDNYNFNYMKVLDESVTVTAGNTDITLTYPVKQIISTNLHSDDYEVGSNGLKLKEASDTDTDITISYYRHSPTFDGADANYIVNDDLPVIYGGTYYAMVFNMAPESQLYQGYFNNAIAGMYARDHQVKPFKWKTSDAIGL